MHRNVCWIECVCVCVCAHVCSLSIFILIHFTYLAECYMHRCYSKQNEEIHTCSYCTTKTEKNQPLDAWNWGRPKLTNLAVTLLCRINYFKIMCFPDLYRPLPIKHEKKWIFMYINGKKKVWRNTMRIQQ